MSLLIAGCDGAPSAPPVLEFDAPQQLSLASEVWVLDPEFTASDESRLQTYFARHPDLAGSPTFAKRPLIYRHGASESRYYWIDGVGDSASWTCLLIRGKTAAISYGQGAFH